MSGPERPEPSVETAPSLKRKNLSTDDQDDLAQLDAVFKRIKTAAPRAPYILSAPSLYPYRYHSQQEANAWMLGHLFRPDEEHLQYRTFVYREPCQDCLELQAGEDDDRASTTGQVAKKKLNLSAFKVRQANGTTTPSSKKPSPDPPPAHITTSHANGVKPTSSTTTASHEPRRETASTDPKANADKSGPSDRTPHGLPPLLSPVHEPPSNPHGLPNILSPTLPSNIQAELDKLATQRKRAESNTSSSSSDRKSQALAVPEPVVHKAADKVKAKAEPRIRSVIVNGKSPNGDQAKRKDDAEQKLIVKFKYTKAQAATIKKLLRLPSRKWKIETKERQDPRDLPTSSQLKVPEEEPKKKKPIPKVAARRSDNTTPAPTPTAKPIASEQPAKLPVKVPEKRPRADDDAQPAVPSKRPKPAPSQDRPHTPTSQVVSSPSLSNKSSAQKGQYATPKSSHKAVSMLRTESAESNDATPGRSVSTPAGVKLEAKGAPTSAPISGKKQADITLLAQTSMKLNQMGRTLKHEATKILIGEGKQVTKQDEKRAAVTNLECIL
jgi:hypothetical protein